MRKQPGWRAAIRDGLKEGNKDPGLEERKAAACGEPAGRRPAWLQRGKGGERGGERPGVQGLEARERRGRLGRMKSEWSVPGEGRRATACVCGPAPRPTVRTGRAGSAGRARGGPASRGASGRTGVTVRAGSAPTARLSAGQWSALRAAALRGGSRARSAAWAGGPRSRGRGCGRCRPGVGGSGAPSPHPALRGRLPSLLTSRRSGWETSRAAWPTRGHAAASADLWAPQSRFQAQVPRRELSRPHCLFACLRLFSQHLLPGHAPSPASSPYSQPPRH